MKCFDKPVTLTLWSAAGVLAISMLLVSCLTVETGTRPQTFTMRLDCDRAPRLDLYRLNESARWEKGQRREGAFAVRIPAMQGGYSRTLGITHNRHDPRTFTVVKVKSGEDEISSLSLNDIEKLPRDDEGRVVIDCGPADE